MEILLLLLLPIILWGVVIYNKLVLDKNRVLASWSDIDVQLKRRHDLIPKLVDAVKAYSHYEQSTLSNITRLRRLAAAAATPREREPLESGIGEQLRSLLMIAEAYPDLKAGEQYLDLLRQLTDIENHIQYARRYYNGAVRNLNVRIDSFPDLLVARALGFRHATFFKLERAVGLNPSELQQ